MRKLYLCLLALLLTAGAALAQSNVDPGWSAFIIRNGATGSPVIHNDETLTQALEIATWESGQKAALGTNMLNGAKVSDIARLHIDRLDNVAISGSAWGPYFNIWVTDGFGHYAVIANEPSNPEWTASTRWDVTSWDLLKTKVCKVYETPGAGANTSWVHTLVGHTSLTFEDVGNLVIEAPLPAYIADPLNLVTNGAPRVLGTNVAYGFNWMFGDTMANYVTGGDGFVVDNYYVSQLVTNVTRGTTHATIQAAVDAANADNLISVPGGIYTEQVHVTLNNLTIQGAGVGTTFIRSPATLPLYFGTSPNYNKPIVFVDGATGVHVDGLTVNGDGKGNANYRFQGVGFWNADGAVTNAAVINVIDTPFSGMQAGVGIYAYNNTGGPYIVTLTNVVVDHFQKNGLALMGTGLTIDLDNVDVTGMGPTAITAQNGIQVAYGATGTVTDCDIASINYTPGTAASCGVLLYGSGAVTLNDVDVTTTQSSFYAQDSNAAFDGCDVASPAGDALYAYSTGAKGATSGRLPALPLDPGLNSGANKSAVTVAVSNGVFTGSGAANSWGPSALGSGPLTFTVEHCEITNWDLGIVLSDNGGAIIDATVENCNIHGNLTDGLYSNAGQVAQATCNWWGALAGPNAPGNPSAGDGVSGLVTYSPWLNGAGGSCSLSASNHVDVGNAAVCLTPATTCVTVPVTFNRLDTTASRGVSVTIQLSPNLVLCTGVPNTSITMASGPGSWRGSYNYWPQIVDNGGGSYTIDQSIIGSPCGPTNGGLLFTVNVAKAPSVTTDQIGTVSVTAVDVRDCDNASLLGIPGAEGHVSINLSIPAALTGLTATQVKTGNDSDGTTKINLAWTAPGGDADRIDLWRKGFGYYPEFDDNPLAGAPAAPVDAGNGWTHVANVAATTTSYADEPGTRDFWYYAAFVTDACGNVSAASALTGGTLNYHLGDVMATDNHVVTSDISRLGAHYGITLATNGDPFNYLDVGPTTNRGVNARPNTDNRIQFEDLMVFAMNYELVSKAFPTVTPATGNAIALVSGQPGSAGSTFDVAIRLSGDGQLQGVSVPLTWDAAVATPIGMRAGDLLTSQGDLALVLSPEPGTIDAALMGVRDQGIAGDGVLATVTFRLNATGDPKVGLGAVSGRDKDNQAVVLSGAGNSLPPVSLPPVSELRANVPNPFNPTTEFSFVLSQSGPVSLRVYTLRGELVRTLVAGDMQAGAHTLTWNGQDDQGRQAASGGYIVRFVAPDRTQSRNITLLK
jgi:hypothetical protein